MKNARYDLLLPVEVLGAVFCGKFHEALKRAFHDGKLNFHGNLKLLAQPKTFAAWLRPLFRKDWVVCSKRPFGGPEHGLRYLGRYTHPVAISNHRLVSFADGPVTFRWRDSAHNNEQKSITLSLDEFLRRFLLHLLPEISCASEISASWPTANVPPPCHFASNCRCGTANRASGLHGRSERSLVLSQVWWADGRRKTHRCLKSNFVLHRWSRLRHEATQLDAAPSHH